MNLNDCTVKELRDLAAEFGIRNRGKLRKDALMAAISEARKLADTAPLNGGTSEQLSSQVSEDLPQPTFGPNGDPGLPIPDSYDQDRLVLMVQDPTHVFAYWEISSGTLDRIRAECGRQTSALLVIHCGDDSEKRVIDLACTNYYLTLPPGSDCVVELAVRDENGHTHVLMRSNQVRTPAHRISDRWDAEWMEVNESFQSLLDMAELTAGGLSSADLVRRLDTVKWDVPRLPSSDSLVGVPSSLALQRTEHLSEEALFSGVSSWALSSDSLSSTRWLKPVEI